MSTFDEVWRMADELRDVLPIFTLTEAERREIVTHMRVRRFREDEVIYHQGDLGHDAFVVHTGLVMSTREDGEGHQLLLSLYGRGQLFGDLELFTDIPGRITTVVAANPTTVLQIAHDDAISVLERNPKAMIFMGRRLYEVSRRYLDLASGLVFTDAQSRVAFVLLELEQMRAREPLSLTQEQIAAAAGVSERTVRRILAVFSKEGLIQIAPRGVRVVDEKRLRPQVTTALGVGGLDLAPRLGDVRVQDA